MKDVSVQEVANWLGKLLAEQQDRDTLNETARQHWVEDDGDTATISFHQENGQLIVGVAVFDEEQRHHFNKASYAIQVVER